MGVPCKVCEQETLYGRMVEIAEGSGRYVCLHCIDYLQDLDPWVIANGVIVDLEMEIERLKEYEWKYNELCK